MQWWVCCPASFQQPYLFLEKNHEVFYMRSKKTSSGYLASGAKFLCVVCMWSRAVFNGYGCKGEWGLIGDFNPMSQEFFYLLSVEV